MRTSQSIIRMALLAAGVTVAVTALAEEPCVFKDGKDVVEKRPVTEVDGAMVPHGLVECFYAGGAKRSKTEWQKGVRNGTDKGWFKDGQQEFDGAWADGLRSGTWTFWYSNGQKRSECEWAKGKRHGKASVWYDNGKPFSMAHFKDGQLDGESKSWYPDGAIQYECAWKEGQPAGKWVFWSQDGKKEREEEMVGQLSVRTYYNAAGDVVKRAAYLGRNVLGTEVKEWEETWKDGKVVDRREYM